MVKPNGWKLGEVDDVGKANVWSGVMKSGAMTEQQHPLIAVSEAMGSELTVLVLPLLFCP